MIRYFSGVWAGEAGPDPEKPTNHNLKSTPGGAVYEGTLCYWVGDVHKPSSFDQAVELSLDRGGSAGVSCGMPGGGRECPKIKLEWRTSRFWGLL